MVRKILIILFLAVPLAVIGKEIPKPNSGNRAFVLDRSDFLTETQEVALCEKLKTYFDSTSNQIAILLEPSLEGEDLFDYTHRVAREWGIGEKEKNNGILIYVATADRKIQIQVGYGLEGAVPDVYAKRVIDKLMLPEFRKGDYYTGLDQAVNRIIEYAEGEYTNDGRDEEGLPPWLVIVLVIIFLAIVISLGGGSKGMTYTGGRRYIGRSGPWVGGGGGGFSGGGGGFGGFGGGSFGGGGASGSW